MSSAAHWNASPSLWQKVVPFHVGATRRPYGERPVTEDQKFVSSPLAFCVHLLSKANWKGMCPPPIGNLVGLVTFCLTIGQQTMLTSMWFKPPVNVLTPSLFSLPLQIITELPTCILHALETNTHTHRNMHFLGVKWRGMPIVCAHKLWFQLFYCSWMSVTGHTCT